MVGNVAVIWKVRPTPSRQISRGFLPVVSWPSRLIRPESGMVLAVEHVEAGALAGAVGTDQRQDFAGLQRERHAAHRMDAAIGFAQAFDRKQRGCDAHSAVSIREASEAGLGDGGRRRFRIVSSIPTMPLGKATTIRTMTPPSTSLDRSVWLTSQMLSAL